MHKKQPYSGKQKKKQLQERKLRKKDGPKYLQDQNDSDSDDNEPAEAASNIVSEDVKVTSEGQSGGPSKKIFGKTDMKNVVQKINQQPSSNNSHRLHFFKESDEVINRKKKDAKRPVKPVDEIHLEYKSEEVYPPDAILDFPKRPPWNYGMTKEKLEQQEKKYFDSYLQEVLGQERGNELSYLELNLQTWRQLWRVTEISDVLAIVADIRYPVLHIPPSLVRHVTQELRKPLIIILNKVDFVPVPLAVAWKRYLCEKFPGIHVVFFTSFPRDVYREEELMDFSNTKKLYKVPHQGRQFPLGPVQLWSACKDIVKDKIDLSSWEEVVHSSSAGTQSEKEQELEDSLASKPDLSQNNRGEDLRADWEKNMASTEPRGADGVLTLGFIGYPNAGKSSVLNALVNKKVVSVSQTPGHTKHFQTIFLTPTVKLCDCPGLVFPSLVAKSLQVIAGIFPVAQVREPYSVVAYLGRRLDLPSLLGLTPPRISPKKNNKETGEYIWSAMDICEAWAMKCGYRTSKAGRPDVYRAANKILRLAVSGELCLSFSPPKFCKSEAMNRSDSDTRHLAQLLAAHAKSRQQVYTHSDSDVHDESEEEEEESEEESQTEKFDLESSEDDEAVVKNCEVDTT